MKWQTYGIQEMLVVFAGGFCGTLARYGVSLFVAHYVGVSLPADILFVNITGAFLLACLLTYAEVVGRINMLWRLFLSVGFLGAYTTFSSLALGVILLAQRGDLPLALGYLLVSLLAGLGATWCGQATGRRLAGAVRPGQQL